MTLFASLGATAQKLGEATVEEVVAAMKSDDKAHFVQGMGVVSTYVGNNAIAGASGYTWTIDRLGIPQVVLVDGPCGVRLSTVFGGATCEATHFPVGTLLASTWDTQLVEEMCLAMGDEVKEYGCDILLAPGINIQRHPLCGRNFEYYSEDPVLAGKIAAAYVRGIQRMGVGCSLKHFAANNQETNRKETNARISQRALREIYLRPFEIAIKESDPWTVMSSYNKLNGLRTSENAELLTSLLRDEWGYKGMVTSDWINNADAEKEIKAGNDMLMPGSTTDYWALKNALDGFLWVKPTLSQDVINTSCKRILEMILRTPRFAGYTPSSTPDLQAHALVARQVAADGEILLKNQDGTLPFPSGTKRFALFGSLSYRTIAGGTGSGAVSSSHTTRLPEALLNAGYSIDETLQAAYEEHIKAEGTDNQGGGMLGQQIMTAKLPREMSSLTDEEIARCAAENDMALLTIGRSASENEDRGEESYYLREEELSLITRVSNAFHQVGKRVVVVLNVSGAVEICSWRDNVDAILMAWLGGQECGAAIVDVLSGDVCPSGKLAQTLPIDYRHHPSAVNFPIGTSIGEDLTRYEEDVFVGYRYFDSYKCPVAYPFGYGMSYTDFAYSNFSAQLDGDTVRFALTVKNVGDVAGREVAQIYMGEPNWQALNRPANELKAFAKTRLLQPGESETLQMALHRRLLSAFDAEESAWVRSAGECSFVAAASIEDVRLSATVSLPDYREEVGNILRPDGDLKMLDLSALNRPEVTGIEAVSTSTATSYDAIYNLSGQRISQPQRGIYIQRGRKMVRFQ